MTILVIYNSHLQEEFPVDTIKRSADLGFGGLFVSPDYGGEKIFEFIILVQDEVFHQTENDLV